MLIVPGPDLGVEGTIKKLSALVGHPDLFQSWLPRLLPVRAGQVT